MYAVYYVLYTTYFRLYTIYYIYYILHTIYYIYYINYILYNMHYYTIQCKPYGIHYILFYHSPIQKKIIDYGIFNRKNIFGLWKGNVVMEIETEACTRHLGNVFVFTHVTKTSE